MKDGILMGRKSLASAPGLDAVLALMAAGASREQAGEILRPCLPDDVSNHLAAHGARGVLATNAILRKDEWELFDRELVNVFRDQMVGVADLTSRGLTFDAGDLGTIILNWQRVSDMDDAIVSMSGVTEDENDSADFDTVGIPIPIIHKGFRVDLRHLLASRRQGGQGIDVTQVTVAARRVADMLEYILFNGTPKTLAVGGKSVYGYRNHPNRNTGSGSDWATKANIYPDVLAMIKKAEDDLVGGPYTLYVNRKAYQQMRETYTNGGGVFQTHFDLVMSIPEIEAVKASQAMPENEAVLVALKREVVDMAIIEDAQLSSWSALNGRTDYFQAWAAMAPRIKADYNGNCGVVHYTGIGA